MASVLLAGALAIAEAPLPEVTSSQTGYPTVDAALKSLQTKPGVQIREQGGWTIISDTEDGRPVLWSFAPKGDPAYPSAVKRSIVSNAQGSFIDMRVQCEAAKAPCDNLVRQFQVLNAQVAQSAKGPQAPAGPTQGPSAPDVVNVTSDSVPGWVPTRDERAQVPLVTHAFLDLLDRGDYHKAYAMMTERQKAEIPFAVFEKNSAAFNKEAGVVRERTIVRVTWTKDPPQAPAPGIYAAVDLKSRFENVDRHCGYIVLYQSSESAPFQVSRQEDNYMSNAQAARIQRDQSQEAMERLWQQLESHCAK
ncbi:MAG: DUF4019 domain-containing protein [Proteobacteria bacterium]|nr:DUF4019 domain-containing protein [Pseudomonadota bacterium]